MPAKARTSQLPTESISPQKARPMFHPCSPYSLRHRVTSSTRGCPPAISSATEDQTDKAQSHLAQTVRAESKPAHGTESSREICSPSPSMLNLSEQIPPCSKKRKDRQRNRLGRSPHAPASQEPKACWRSGSADRTAPGQISQAPGLRELRFAASEQILPLIGNRKPTSDRTHWLQPRVELRFFSGSSIAAQLILQDENAYVPTFSEFEVFRPQIAQCR